MEEGGIVEEASSARTVRWVDGSEVDSESPPWSIEEEALVLGPELQTTLRRRLVKKAPSVDSLDVEAMDIADAHKRREKIAFTSTVFPCLLLAYMGQAAYLMKHPYSAERIFYDSVPGEPSLYYSI
ncbi:hypothetical protein B296_00049089 [Ensete ventricosum]|uniref:K+ potassium transporter integral membrane domain-containing protein n=1 Tax=Ensete ventricosum TaxID=4639 RepID=A0A426YJD0_ENSVE|nr:hypothetical protein B296_00049089 [Ensete ventricosum]